MCGIAGLAGHPAPQDAAALVQSMMASMQRRGPDGEGLEQWPGAVLGHRRLSIFDLTEAGRQPMLSPDGEIGVVFNGAIYNFLDIRRELEQHGHRFRSQCDTEVLVYGYRQWGIDALVSRLRGMFAFAVWDNPNGRLTMVRDRLGVKPLIYRVKDGTVAFASTVRALALAGLAEDVDEQAVLEFLEFGWVSDGRSIYGGVRKLKAGHILEFANGRAVEREYWMPALKPTAPAARFEEAMEETERLLLDAVRVRLEADVPVAALLSGGIDTTLVCWALSKLNANIRTFTVGTHGDAADESAAARETARMLGVPHETIELPADEQPELEDLISAYGEPFACPSALGMLRVCRAVKPHATVLLTGDGGDDVFLGYTHHRNIWLAQRLARRLPEAVAASWPRVRPLFHSMPLLRRPEHLLNYATGGVGEVLRANDGLPYFETWGMLGERLKGRQISHREIAPSFGSAREVFPEFLDYERRTRFVAEYMTKVDGAAMFYSIEARSPFLDHRLWEMAATLPYELRLRKGELKAILRALVRKHVGKTVASRRKQGFTIPVQTWLASSWAAALKELRENSLLESGGWIRRGRLSAAIDKSIADGRVPNQLWHVLVLEQWMRAERTRVPATAHGQAIRG